MPHGIVSFDDEAIKGYVGKLVAKTVEETPDALLDEEADQLVNAERHERTDERQAYRSGHHSRRLVTGAGELTPSVPKGTKPKSGRSIDSDKHPHGRET